MGNAGRYEDERPRAHDDLLVLDDHHDVAFEDVEGVVLAGCTWSGGPSPGCFVMIEKLKRGVSAVRARNSTFATR